MQFTNNNRKSFLNYFELYQDLSGFYGAKICKRAEILIMSAAPTKDYSSEIKNTSVHHKTSVIYFPLNNAAYFEEAGVSSPNVIPMA